MTSTEPQTESKPQTEIMTEAPTHLKRLVLTGFMGAGKSTIGRLLAARIGWNFLDLDAHLESRTNATIPQLFEQHGEARFRRLESTALASALGYSPRTLSRATLSAAGVSAKRFLDERVTLEAKRLLMYTEMTVAQCAHALGFSQAANFTTFFATHTGQPPSQWRDVERRSWDSERPR